MGDFLKTHFDKLLLSALFLIALGLELHFVRELLFYSSTVNVQHLSGIVTWLENTVGQILAALLTLMVGRSMVPSQPPPPAPPPAGWEKK